jgi:hypothetical protein
MIASLSTGENAQRPALKMYANGRNDRQFWSTDAAAQCGSPFKIYEVVVPDRCVHWCAAQRNRPLKCAL